MKLTISTQGAGGEDTPITLAGDKAQFRQVSLDDEGYNGFGFVSIRIGGVTDPELVASVHLDELYPAVVALQDKYLADLKRAGQEDQGPDSASA